MSKNKILFYLKWIAATIIFSAIGSGMWDLFLSDIFSWVANIILRAATNFSVAFSNELHSKISSGPQIALLLMPSAIAIAFLPMVPAVMVYFLLFYDVEENENQKIQKNIIPNLLIKNIRKIYITIFVLLFFILVFISVQANYTYKASNFIEKSIDIFATHLSNKEVLELRAKYRGINCASKFYALEKELRKLEEFYQVSLPEFESI